MSTASEKNGDDRILARVLQATFTRSDPPVAQAGFKGSLFAIVLQSILEDHRLTFWYLTTRVGIHREKVRRLIASLHKPHFILLSPEDFEAMDQSIPLNGTEILRLQAAILATVMENYLSSIMDLSRAQQTAEGFYNLFYAVLLRNTGNNQLDTLGLASPDASPSSRNVLKDSSLDMAIELIDRGIAEATLRNFQTPPGQISHSDYLKLLRYFTDGLYILSRLPDDIKATAKWQDWHKIAHKEAAEIIRLIQQLLQEM